MTSTACELQLGLNEHPVRWCLRRVHKGAPISKRNLALFQNPPMFYAGLGVSKREKMTDVQKTQAMAKSLNEFVIEAWIRWLNMRH